MTTATARVRALERYRQPVEGPLAFIRDQVVLPTGQRVGDVVGGDPWIERDLLRPVFERDADGLPRYRLAYIEVARGHWKTGGAGAVAIAEAVLHDSTDVVVCAGDRDQAAIALEAIDGYLRRNSELARSFRRRSDVAEVEARGSRIRVVSSDAPTAWGLGGTHGRFRVICDELTVWKTPALWEALASATGKVKDAQTIVLSNAGFDPGNSWQYRVRQAAEREPWGHLFSPRGVIASWIATEWIEQMRALLPGPTFDRVIGNTWVTETGDFVTAAQWRACVDDDWARQSTGTADAAYVAGLDLGLTKDRTALAIVHHDPRLGRLTLDDLQVWEGTRADPVSVSGVERAVLDAARRFPGLVVRADPWQMKGSMERLERAGVRIRGFDFTAGSVQRLSTVLYSLITSATLRVYPDPELEREVLGLRVVQKAGGWRLDHAAGGYSDRVMALALAVLDVPTGPPEPSVQYSMIDGLDLRVGEQLVPGVVVDPWFAEDYPDGP